MFFYCIFIIFNTIFGSTITGQIWLPKELELKIFEQLDCKTVVGLKLTNKAFYEIVQSCKVLDTTEMFHRNYQYFRYDFIKNYSIKKHLEKIQKRETIIFFPKQNKKTPDDEFFTFCQTMKKAKEIKIYTDIGEWDISLLSKLQETNIHTIHFAKNIDKKHFLQIDFSKFQSLKNIEIYYFSFPKKELVEKEYFFPIIEKIHNSSIEFLSIKKFKYPYDKNDLFSKDCFLYFYFQYRRSSSQSWIHH